MLCIVRYKKHGNTFLAKATKNPNEYMIIEILGRTAAQSCPKVGGLVTQGKNANNKEFIHIDSEEKLGEFLLEYKL